MDNYIKKYFSQVSDDQLGGSYFHVIVLHDSPDVSWEDISGKVPSLQRGWYELSRLDRTDRIEFCRDYWISKLPYHPDSLRCITQFFGNIEDIGIVLAQKKFNDQFSAHMIYTLQEQNGFFHGGAPLSESDTEVMHEMFPEVIFPEDYLAFMEIHNGFSKASDTGVFCTHVMPEAYKRFLSLIGRESPLLTTKGKTVNPHTLIPFYESFGMPFFQCFWKDWYPENEMGNVYYSGSTHTISDPVDKNLASEEMSFPTFMDWLFFYLEIVV